MGKEEKAYIYIVSRRRECYVNFVVAYCIPVGSLTRKEAEGCDFLAKKWFNFLQCEKVIKEQFLEKVGRKNESLFIGTEIICQTESMMNLGILMECQGAITHTLDWIKEVDEFRRIRMENPGVDAKSLDWFTEGGGSNPLRKALEPNPWECIVSCLQHCQQRVDEIRGLRPKTSHDKQEDPVTISPVSQTEHTKQKNTGRKPASPAEITKDRELVAVWNDAKSKGITKKEFAQERNMTTRKVDAAIDRDRKRKNRSNPR